MSAGDDISVTGGGDKDITLRSDFFHRGDLITGHGGLKSIDWVDFSNDDTRTVSAKCFSTLF